MTEVMNKSMAVQLLSAMSDEYNREHGLIVEIQKIERLEKEKIDLERKIKNTEQKIKQIENELLLTKRTEEEFSEKMKKFLSSSDFEQENVEFRVFIKEFSSVSKQVKNIQTNLDEYLKTLEKFNDACHSLVKRIRAEKKKMMNSPYDRMLQLIKNDEELHQKAENIAKMKAVFDTLKIPIDVHLTMDVSNIDFGLTSIDIGEKCIETELVEVSERIDIWNGEVEGRIVLSEPVLNFKTGEEVRNCFRELTDNPTIFIETIKGSPKIEPRKQYIKGIYIKVPFNADFNFIRITTRDNQVTSDERSLDVDELLVELLEYPYTI